MVRIFHSTGRCISIDLPARCSVLARGRINSQTCITGMPGLFPPPTVPTRFSIRGLEILNQQDPRAEACNRAMRQIYNWDSYERLYREYLVSVAPYYPLLSHGVKMDLLAVARHAQENPHPPSKSDVHGHGNLIVDPLDVFSLPFRYMHRNETMEYLAEQYGVTYVARYP
jgi:hypothetical protein